jgi:hypothetical protein
MINSISSLDMPKTMSTPADKPAADAKARIGFWALFGSPDPPQSTPQTGSPSAAQGPTDKKLGFWALFTPAMPSAQTAPAGPVASTVTASAALAQPLRASTILPTSIPFDAGAGTIPWRPAASTDAVALYQAARSRVLRWEAPIEQVKL